MIKKKFLRIKKEALSIVTIILLAVYAFISCRTYIIQQTRLEIDLEFQQEILELRRNNMDLRRKVLELRHEILELQKGILEPLEEIQGILEILESDIKNPESR